MKKKNKLSLNELKVKSFVTNLDMKKDLTIRGGSDTLDLPDLPDEPTGLGASCEWTMCASHECPPALALA